MNVKQLIAELVKLPGDLPVFAYIKDDICSEVDGVSLAVKNGCCASEWDEEEDRDPDDEEASKPNAVALSLEHD